MEWIITTVFTFIFLLWFVRKAHVLPAENGKVKPIGLKVWSLFVIIVISVIPIINALGISAVVIWLCILLFRFDDMDWNEIFPSNPNKPQSKLSKMLNKDLFK